MKEKKVVKKVKKSKKIFVNQANLDVKEFCKKEDQHSFTALSSIHVKRKYTEATDGKSLIRVENSEVNEDDYPVIEGEGESKDFKELLVNKEDIKDFKIKKSDDIPILENAYFTFHGKKASLLSYDLSNVTKKLFTPFDGTFPDSDKVFPDMKDYISLNFDAKQMLKIMKYAVKHGIDPYSDLANIKMSFHKNKFKEKILIFEFRTKNDQKVKVLLMPCKEK